MADKRISRMSELMDIDDVIPPTYKPQDHYGDDILILGYEGKTGDLGDYYLLRCVMVDTSEERLFITGSYMIKAQLNALGEEPNYPIAFQFQPSGRSYYMK